MFNLINPILSKRVRNNNGKCWQKLVLIVIDLALCMHKALVRKLPQITETPRDKCKDVSLGKYTTLSVQPMSFVKYGICFFEHPT